MGDTLLKRISTILVKEEAAESYGVDVIPAAGDGIDVFDLIPPQPIPKKFNRERDVGHYGQDTYMGGRYLQASFKTDLKGNGTVQDGATITDHGKLWHSCNALETKNVGTDITYTPFSGEGSSLSMYFYVAGGEGADEAALYKMLGSRGNCRIIMVAGEPAICEWTFWGIYAQAAASTLVIPTGLESQEPPIVLNTALQFDEASTEPVETIEFDMGNQLEILPDHAAATGYKKVWTTDRKPTVSFNPEVDPTLIVKLQKMLEQDAAEPPASLIMTIGAVAGNKHLITFGKLNVVDIPWGDRSKIRTHEVACELKPTDAGDDEWSIKCF